MDIAAVILAVGSSLATIAGGYAAITIAKARAARSAAAARERPSEPPETSRSDRLLEERIHAAEEEIRRLWRSHRQLRDDQERPPDRPSSRRR